MSSSLLPFSIDLSGDIYKGFKIDLAEKKLYSHKI